MTQGILTLGQNDQFDINVKICNLKFKVVHSSSNINDSAINKIRI
jgi:hypothetical protein